MPNWVGDIAVPVRENGYCLSQSHPQTLEAETVRTLCSHPTRRSVLDVLRTSDQVTPRELARCIVTSDRGFERDGSGLAARRTITVALVHNHLPKLEAHDVVDYRGPATAVTPGENFDELVSVLD
ncbi:hypothetical protein [Natrinema sp. H-ect4]|uniref:DUF7344 domain-containing protein n=1 Tax=Natrinema sp. H-ect4 TaxID=3242699 RepID=UPI0035A8987D